MSRKKNSKRPGGDPRKQTSGRVTPKSQRIKPKNFPPKYVTPQPGQLGDAIAQLTKDERLLMLSLPKPAPQETYIPKPPPIDPPLNTYRIDGYEAFDPIYDEDPYFQSLREAFAREMKFLTGDYYPDPEIAKSAHEEFINKLMDTISLRLPELAIETSGIIEQHFIERFKNRGESERDFRYWDRNTLGCFFTDNIMLQRCLSLTDIRYFDEIQHGPAPLAFQYNFSFTQYGFDIIDSDTITPLPEFIILSKLVNQGLVQGYNIDEIIEGVIQKTVALEVLNIGSRSHAVMKQDNLEAFQIGLSRALFSPNPDETPGRLGGWGHNAIVAALHVRLNPLYGVDYRNEAEIFEILSKINHTFFERVFEATFANNPDPYPDAHLLFTEEIKMFGERFLGKNTQEIEMRENLEVAADMSLLSDTLTFDLHTQIYSILATDPKLTQLGIAIQQGIASKTSELAFYAPPGMLGDLTR